MKFSKSTRSRFLRRNSVIGPSSLLDASWLGDRFYIVKELFSTYLAPLADAWEVCPALGACPSFDYPLPLGRAVFGSRKGVGYGVTNRKGFRTLQTRRGLCLLLSHAARHGLDGPTGRQN